MGQITINQSTKTTLDFETLVWKLKYHTDNFNLVTIV